MFVDGWYYTGDVGLLNPDLGVDSRGRGHLVLIDRKKNLTELYDRSGCSCDDTHSDSLSRARLQSVNDVGLLSS